MSPQNLEEKLARLEALLFVHGEPLQLKKIQAVLGLKKDEADVVIGEFRKKLDAGERGLTLVYDKEKVQLTTKPEFSKVLESFIKEELSLDLTPASLEALSIVAYFGPITRNRLEYLRGVNSVFILRILMLRGLIERFPSAEYPNAFLYQPTFNLIKHLGLRRKEDLPDYEKFQLLLKTFESQNAVVGPSKETSSFSDAG